jgi:hypothetical protein
MGPSHYGQNSDWKYNPAHRANVPYTNSVLSNRFSNTPAIQQARMQESRQQSAKNFWSQNSTQQEKQNVQQVHQNAQKAWNNASPQQHQNVQNPRSNVTRMRSAAPSSNSRSEGGESFGGHEGGGEGFGGHGGGGEFRGGGFRR